MSKCHKSIKRNVYYFYNHFIECDSHSFSCRSGIHIPSCHYAEILEFDTVTPLLYATICNEISQTHYRLLFRIEQLCLFSQRGWGTHDLLFAVLETAWSPVLQYWSMHGCLFALLWYILSFLNPYHIWRRLEAVASLLMMFEVYWDMMPCADISEALHFQIPNSLKKWTAKSG
jgi:hypothetical protein